MDIMKLGIQLLSERLGGGVSEDNVGSALSGLLGDGSGGLDIGSIVGKLMSNGAMGDLVGSWLGDGANQGINPAQLLEIFGGDKISSFAQTLGVDQETAASGLSDVLPALIDKSSSGGSLLDSVGGLGGALDMAKKLF